MTTLTRRVRTPIGICLPVVLLLASAAPASAQLGDRALKPGARGADVRELQSLLRRLGLGRLVTGFYGPETEAAVREWERQAGEKRDGEVSRSDVSQMRRSPAAPSQANGGTDPAAPPPPQPKPIDRPPVAPVGAIPTRGYVFPIRAAHNFGTAINRFGAPRSGHTHQGQDVFALAGSPVVAARGGRVTNRATQAAAGNYVVIQGDDGFSYVYMHLQAPGSVAPGQAVQAGQPIGRVGCTGSCSGDHLHFEVWVGRWYGGGRAIDPLRFLRAWDGLSSR